MGCRVKGMSVQDYRRSYDYRGEYFKKNPGLFGCIWFCSLCHKPLIGKKNVEVDHIRPLNKGGLNHVSNCTACCRECNRSKSDIVDSRMYKEYTFKAFESMASTANRGVGGAAMLGVGLLTGTASATVNLGTKGTKGAIKLGGKGIFKLVGLVLNLGFSVVKLCGRVVLFPIANGSFLSRLMFLLLYALFAMHYGAQYTDIFNAWM